MKIAIVAPCPVPYVVGGAEKLWWGLAAHFNERTQHQAEIIKLPSPEHDLASLVRSYEAFAALDLGGFDMVISGKYPAWMVAHGRHVCYMLHRLRGLYDAYPGGEEVAPEVAADPRASALQEFMRRYEGQRAALPEFFGRWGEIAGAHAKPPGLLEFPGPFARALVHWLDDIGLAPNAIARYAAISHAVAQRPGYFPAGAEVAVAHPPPHAAMAAGTAREHFYTVSRLDAPKRVALVVEAFEKVRTQAPLVIGGSGPEEARLRDLARRDPRIRFAGFQSDADVREHYARAIAVPFVPYEEDYGLIAVEAMQCAKPVVTTRDSGGVRELVEDGVSGFVCEPDAASLAAALQRLADDGALAAAMGERARESAARVTWEAVADALLAAPARAAAAAPRRKLLVATTFPIHPPRHGGQSRVYHLYRALAADFETVVVSVCPAAEPAFEGEIAPGLREVRVPMSREHERRLREWQAEVGTPLTDVTMPELYAYTPALGAALEREAQGASAAVACHPYVYPALRRLGLPICYEAQDVEAQLKAALFEGRPRGAELLAAVETVERETLAAARLVLCTSQDDADELVRRYATDPARMVVVPNGTDPLRIGFTAAEARAVLRERLGVDSLALFMGSGHWPNIEATKRMFEFARALPAAAFAVLGSVCYAFEPGAAPDNVLLLGEVDEITRNLCLQLADVALNPVEHGSGTNLKMLDFFAAGAPVVSTELGARGLGLAGETQCRIATIDAFPAAIEDVLGAGADAAARRALAARALVEREFDWQAIGGRLAPRLLEALGR